MSVHAHGGSLASWEAAGLGGKGRQARGWGWLSPAALCHGVQESKLEDALQVVRKVYVSRWEDRKYCSNGDLA